MSRFSDVFSVAVCAVSLVLAGQPERPTKPVLFDTPEADRILSAMQVFPADNPWNEDISGRPVHPNSRAIIDSIGADTPLGYNLDMNFVIVPPDQPKVPVRVTMYPAESDPGPFPVPDNAPIENWPMSRNEDPGALPKPGVTLEQFQREGTGDRHLIIVDPINHRLHEFWQARRTDSGWEASQASTFDLASNALRPERWTSSDAAGLPIFPSIVRYDDVTRRIVMHAMRVTVRRTRREYVYPARHFASPHTDPNLPRMGERLRLRRDFDTSNFPPHARAILEGLKQYGMFVADNGSDWLMSIAPDRRLQGLETLSRVKGSDFEVIVPTGPDEGPRGKPRAGHASISGIVVTLVSGEPVANASVSLYTSTPVNGHLTATTDGSGRFQFTNISGGRYSIAVIKSGFVTIRYGERIYGRGGRAISLRDDERRRRGRDDPAPLEIKPNQQVTGVVVTLTDRRIELTGTILTDTGDPAPEYTVVVYPTDEKEWPFEAHRVIGTRAGQDGTFRMIGLRPGEYRVTTLLDAEFGCWFDPAFLRQIDRDAKPLSIVDGQKNVLNLRVPAGR